MSIQRHFLEARSWGGGYMGQEAIRISERKKKCLVAETLGWNRGIGIYWPRRSFCCNMTVHFNDKFSKSTYIFLMV